MPLSFTPLLRLKHEHVCDQWHPSWVFTLLLPVHTVNCVQTLKGNFTFDTCSSEMSVGLALFRRTTNLTQSEGFAREGRPPGGQAYRVPLYHNDEQYQTVDVGGLVQVQPGLVGAVRVF